MTKRQILEELKRNELIAVVERFELPVADRRVRSLLIEALASSRKAPIAEILGDLKRDRLKELCRAFDLDDGGREKAVIVERLTGAKPRKKDAAQAAASPTQGTLPQPEEPEAPSETTRCAVGRGRLLRASTGQEETLVERADRGSGPPRARSEAG